MDQAETFDLPVSQSSAKPSESSEESPLGVCQTLRRTIPPNSRFSLRQGRPHTFLPFFRPPRKPLWSGVVLLANDMGPLLVNLLLATFNGRSAKECAWFSGQHRANKYYT